MFGSKGVSRNGCSCILLVVGYLIIHQFPFSTPEQTLEPITMVVNVTEEKGELFNVVRPFFEKKRDVRHTKDDANGRYIGWYSPNCSQTIILYPHLKEVEFRVHPAILKEGKLKTCHWSIFGFDDCVPVLDCPHFRLKIPRRDEVEYCQDEYLEVTDGSYGYQRFCGTDRPEELTNGRKFRDLFLTLQLEWAENDQRRLHCKVTCVPGRVRGDPLDENSYPEVNEDCECGRSRHPGIPTKFVDSQVFPWVAALVKKGTNEPFCAGSLINDRFVLTSAHCFTGIHQQIQDMEVLLNPNRQPCDLGPILCAIQNFDGDNIRPYRFAATRYFIHPLYNAKTKDFDVALIRLRASIRFIDDREIYPICLPPIATYLLSNQGSSAIVSSWIFNDTLSPAPRPVVHTKMAEIVHPDHCNSLPGNRVTKRMLCANKAGGHTTPVNFGSPLVYDKGRKTWQQVGVFTFFSGATNNNNNVTGVYTKIQQVIQWIRYVCNMEQAVWCHGIQ